MFQCLKRQHLEAAGLDPALRASMRLPGSGPTAPALPCSTLLSSATSSTHVCCHPTEGTPLTPVPWGPHNQPKGEHGVTAPSALAFSKKTYQDSPRTLTNYPEPKQTPGLAREQLLHQG